MCRTMTKSDNELVCRTISSKYLMRRPWMTVRCDSVAIPGGKVNPEYYVLEYPGWINVIAIDESGNMLLERQWRQAAGIISTEIPAGVMEKGETPLQAAQRELLEETGYTGGEWSELLTLYPNPGLMNKQVSLFSGPRCQTDRLSAPRRDRVSGGIHRYTGGGVPASLRRSLYAGHDGGTSVEILL